MGGAVLNNNSAYQARGFWYEDDRAHHITWKELRAVRHAVESFLAPLRGRRVLLHEDNTAVVAALTNLTSRSPVMMEELRKLWHLPDIHDISIRPRYIQSAANVWADRLSRELDDFGWQLNPRIFAHLQRLWGPHTVDRFASMENTQEGLRPMHATASTVVRYTAWVGIHGTIGAESLQQYYSSINKYFRDHHRQLVALGEMVADARRGLAIPQERLAEEDVRVALTAPVAESGISCETGDLVVDRPSGSILLYVRKQKGDQRTRVSAKPLMDLPIATVPDFAGLLD
eukprot:jgi/Tetstr1/466332/TSEL_010863.t1